MHAARAETTDERLNARPSPWKKQNPEPKKTNSGWNQTAPATYSGKKRKPTEEDDQQGESDQKVQVASRHRGLTSRHPSERGRS